MSAEKDIIERLLREMGEFSKRQKSIASFICDNCDKAAFMTAEMLSEAAGVSESTVVRFAVELGYEGYPELRKALQMVLRERLDASRDLRLRDGLSPSTELLVSSLTNDAEDLRRCINDSNIKGFETLAELCRSASEIYILGFCDLCPLAEYMENSLVLIRKNVRYLRANILDYLSSISPSALIIALDRAGGDSPRLALSRFAADKNVSVALLCTGEPSPALSFADSIIQAEGSAGLISIIDALSAALWAAENKKIADKRAEIDYLRMEYISDGK